MSDQNMVCGQESSSDGCGDAYGPCPKVSAHQAGAASLAFWFFELFRSLLMQQLCIPSPCLCCRKDSPEAHFCCILSLKGQEVPWMPRSSMSLFGQFGNHLCGSQPLSGSISIFSNPAEPSFLVPGSVKNSWKQKYQMNCCVIYGTPHYGTT